MSYFAQHGEDQYIRRLFPNENNGVCIEVGAYDGISLSNTLHFEQNGWRALCIEPIQTAFDKCKQIRKECYQCCISNADADDKEFTIFHLDDNLCAISSLEPDARLVESHKHLITNVSKCNVKVRSLDSLLAELNFPKNIDFISIDTENTELDVLKGIDLNVYNVKLFVIENNYDEPFCSDYLSQYGYEKIQRIAVNDFYIKKSAYLIPIVIISFNNYKFVENMVKQLENILIRPNILIIDNNSQCKYTISYINECSKKYNVLKCDQNYGHLVWANPSVFNQLPDQFIITDPDLQFNVNTPNNFIDILMQISNKYESNKVGFALDIFEPEKMFKYRFDEFNYIGIPTICESQKQYWVNRIDNPEYEMYFAEVDTTFCLYNKRFNGKHIRLAGEFTMKHLPWYIDIDGISRFSRYIMYKDSFKSSSIAHFEMKYMNDNKILAINKNTETILVQGGIENNDNFWINIYPNWENDTFNVFDKYLDPNKQFLDIGGWIGTTCLYASRKSSHVVCIEADPISVEILKQNVALNYINTIIDVEHKAIYSETTDMIFGSNSNSLTSQLNDSMSQLKLGKTKDNDVIIKTITFQEIIAKYNLNNLSLIKLDIEGGEEFILDTILEYSKHNNVPAYISFHYSWWHNKDLDRFSYLDENHKKTIINDPFCSIVFA